MEDFRARSTGMNRLNLIAGLGGCAATFLLHSEGTLYLVLAILSGGLIGVSLEKRYLNEMSGILTKLYEYWERNQASS